MKICFFFSFFGRFCSVLIQEERESVCVREQEKEKEGQRERERKRESKVCMYVFVIKYNLQCRDAVAPLHILNFFSQAFSFPRNLRL